MNIVFFQLFPEGRFTPLTSSMTLYPLLTRLKNNGLLSYSWKESTSGPPRKYYILSPAGLEVLKRLDGTWEELSYAVKVSIEGREIEKTNQA